MSEQTRTESAAFLEYALCRVAMAAGMSREHAGYIADAIVFAHRQGKLNQGLGVYEAIDLVLEVGVMDPTAVPELVQDGPSYAVYDGHRSSGYYTLNLMARTAIEKARGSDWLKDVMGELQWELYLQQAERELEFFGQQVTQVETDRYLRTL